VLGTLLLEKSRITRDDLVDAMSFQLQEEICDLFVWESLEFTFEDGEPDMRLFSEELLKSKVSLSTEMLVIEAARRIDEWTRLKDYLPSFSDVYRCLPNKGEQTGLDEYEVLVFENVNGENDIDDILERTRLDRYTTLNVLAQLRQKEYIEPLTGDELFQLSQKKEFSDIRRKKDLLSRAIELGMNEAEGFLQVAEIYDELDEPKEASLTYMKYGRMSSEKGDLEGAQFGYQMSLEFDPGCLRAYEELGTFLVADEKNEEAGKIFTEAAEYLMGEGEAEKAKSFWEKALDVHEGNIDAHIGLGGYYELKEEPSQANIEFGRAAEMVLESGKRAEAVGLYRHMLMVDSDCLEAGLNLAKTLGEMNRTEEAVQEYQKLADSLLKAGVIENPMNWAFLTNVYENIVELSPDNKGAREWLATAYEEKKDTDKAVEHYNSLITIYLKEDEHLKAEEALDKLVTLKPDDPHLRVNQARIRIAQGRKDEALDMLAKTGKEFLEKGDTEGARLMFEDVLNKNAFNVEAHEGIVELLIKEDKIGLASRYLCRIGKMCRGAEQYKQAVKALKRAAELNDEDITPLRELSEILIESPEADVPESVVKRYINIQIRRNNYGEALGMCESLISQHPDKHAYKKIRDQIQKEIKGFLGSLSTFNEEEWETEERNASIEALKHVITHSPDDIKAREKLAKLYKQGGDPLKAAQLLNDIAAIHEKAGDKQKARQAQASAESILRKLEVPSERLPKVEPKKKPEKKPEKKSKKMPEKKAVKKAVKKLAEKKAERKSARPSRRKKKVKPKSKKALFKDVPMSLDDFEKGFK
jgi:tetratricopeptide (TPR) repeat protein